jgi:Zn-dependent membrane protease YugP
MKTISERGYLVGNEVAGARRVLTAAAFTYLAAMIASLIQLLRLLAIARRR